MLQKREGELPEEYREELERLKDKEAMGVPVLWMLMSASGDPWNLVAGP